MGTRRRTFVTRCGAASCLAAALSASSAEALVCGECSQVACGFSFESLTFCGEVASNHEVVIRPNCLAFIPEEAFPTVYLASGEQIDGYFEQLPPNDPYQEPRYRFSSSLPDDPSASLRRRLDHYERQHCAFCCSRGGRLTFWGI